MTVTIVGLASTQSRGRRPGRPVTLSTCSDVYEYATDGRRLLSWPMGQYGPLLGFPNSYGNNLTSGLIRELKSLLSNGVASLGSYPPELEQRLADKLASIYSLYLRSPDIGIRFFSDGTSATQAAVALARHATRREAFVSVGYHGGSSPVFTTPPQNGGILGANGEGRFDASFGQINTLEYHDDNLACVIVEVPAVENELSTAEFLKGVSDDCKRNGVPFVLDDVVTGFRFAPAGALGYYSKILGKTIQADFICLGKALSTYGKVSALLGPLDIMESLADKVFASYTFNDHPLGFADALWTLGEYEKYADRLYDKNGLVEDNLCTVGTVLKSRLNHVFKKYNFPAKCIGHPARSAIFPKYDDGMSVGPTREKLIRTLLSRVVDEHDVLLHMPQFVTLAHNLDHVEQTLTAVETVLKTL